MTNIPTRIRLKSASPLPEFRIWFPIPQDVESIEELKTLIYKSIISLKKSDFQPSHLMLELEDYELPDESPVNLLREGDIVLIKCRPTLSPPKKRKPEHSVLTSSSQRKKRRLSTSSSSSSSSTSSDGSSSTSSDNSSSTSTSNSETSSSEESTSSSSIKPIPIKKSKEGQNYVKLQFDKTQSIGKRPIPPGMGKPSTHSRNRRRKVKRSMQKTQENVQNMNEGQQSQTTHQTVEDGAIHDHLPCFSPPHSDTLQQQRVNLSPSKSPGNLPHPFASFIPPSERADLPSNILVTSIDVEDASCRKDHSVYEANVEVEELPYGTILDWGMIDENWNTYPKIISSTSLSKGTIVGWRAFGLNPSTLTPDVSLLHLGKILEIGTDDNDIRITILSRGMASFGGVILEEESEEEITRKTEDMVLENWRIIDQP